VLGVAPAGSRSAAASTRPACRLTFRFNSSPLTPSPPVCPRPCRSPGCNTRPVLGRRSVRRKKITRQVARLLVLLEPLRSFRILPRPPSCRSHPSPHRAPDVAEHPPLALPAPRLGQLLGVVAAMLRRSPTDLVLFDASGRTYRSGDVTHRGLIVPPRPAATGLFSVCLWPGRPALLPASGQRPVPSTLAPVGRVRRNRTPPRSVGRPSISSCHRPARDDRPTGLRATALTSSFSSPGPR